MIQQKTFLAVISLSIAALSACDSNEIGDSKDVNQDKIYMDYNISYTQADENVSLNFKYRFAGSAGTTLVLNQASKVELDGEKLKVDSSAASGAFYEARKKISGFTGKHSIAFTDINGKIFETSFDFTPFVLNALPDAADRNKELVISYNSITLSASDYVEINSNETDSSFNYTQAGSVNSISIPASELLRQKGKSLSFSCTLYREIPLQQTTSEGGHLRLVYRLNPVKIRLRP